MPIWTNIVMIAYLAFWLVTYSYMITRGEAIKDDQNHAVFQDRSVGKKTHGSPPALISPSHFANPCPSTPPHL